MSKRELFWIIVAGQVLAYMINSVILAALETYAHVPISP